MLKNFLHIILTVVCWSIIVNIFAVHTTVCVFKSFFHALDYDISNTCRYYLLKQMVQCDISFVFVLLVSW